ncbi:MAG: hypothetical protein JNK15_17710 [Planctomycetes bacterium]|nr:hypothetical protein [Planctomycetota bacterium]
MTKTQSTSGNPASELRETLFGDVPLEQWGKATSATPWSQFAAAARSLADGDTASARGVLQAILPQKGLESRHYLQAWHGLRSIGVAPAATEGKHVYGVVVDVPVATGVDTVAAYEDGSARYLNYTGSAVIWDAPDDRMAHLVAAVVAEGAKIAARIGPWEGARPPLPAGMTRLSMLTPSGLHFGQASFEVLAREPMAAPLIQAVTKLMQALIEFATKR